MRPLQIIVFGSACLSLACGSDTAGTADAGPPCGTTASSLMDCVESERISSDIDAIGLERVPGSDHWQVVQDLCRTRFEEAGYQTEVMAYDTGFNVIARRPGTAAGAGEVIVSAHYDHISGCAGADDNASGVAAVLEIARVLAEHPNAHPLVFACWDEEETGLIGSRAYADAARADGTAISAMISFDGIAYRDDTPGSQTESAGFDVLFPEATAEIEANESRGDFIFMTGDEQSAALSPSVEAHGDSIGLPVVATTVPENLKLSFQISDLRRSDHASFWFNDYPGILLTDTANFRNPNYHCPNGAMDVPSTLDIEFATLVTRAALGATVDALDAP